MDALALGWTDAGLVVLTATVVYGMVMALSRLFGARQFATVSSYDLPFVFAIGSLTGRVILVRTSLGAAALGLVVLFTLHSGVGWLHHHVDAFHRITQNHPILLVADGRVLDDQMRRARVSVVEVHAAVRKAGLGTLDDVAAVVLERTGEFSVVRRRDRTDQDVFGDVVAADRLLGPGD